MPLFSSLRDYAKRHRKGLLLTAAIGGGSYLVGRYATTKLREMQEKATAERVAKENLKRRFQQNQNDCVFTVLSLLPTLGDQILYEMNIEAAWAKLQESRKLEKKQEKLRREKEAAAAAAAAAAETTEPAKNEPVEKADNTENTQANGEKAQKPEENNGSGVNEDNKHGDTVAEQKESLKTKDVQGNQSTLDASVGSLTASGYSDESHSPIPGLLDKKAKYVLWEDIKISSFTRSLTSIYSLTLLTLLTHIQLNLLGRFTYVWSVSVLNQSEPTIRLQRADEEPEGGFLNAQTERMFLSASWWLLHRGWRACAERVKEAVDEVVGTIPLKRIIAYEDATLIMNKLRRRIEFEADGTTPISYRLWMLPETEADVQEFLLQAGFSEGYPKNNESQTVDLKRLLDETKDYIDSPDFATVLSTCLDEVFAIFDHQAFAKALLPDGGPMDFMGQKIYEANDNEAAQFNAAKKVTLANLLPSISRQAHLVISGNEYLNAFAYIKELQAFSAMIYTQYDETTLNN